MQLRRSKWLVVFFLLVSATLGCSDDDEPTRPQGTDVGVGVAGFTFAPASVTVSPNAEVVWKWGSSGVPHNVTLENGPASATQPTGEFKNTFRTAGTFRYRCTLHSIDFSSGMVGSVQVR